MRSRLLVLARLVAAALLVVALFAPAVARAAGSVIIADSQPKEVDGKWKLKMTMNYGSTPPTAHIPMLFSFTPVVLYERSLTDQSPKTPVLTKLPLVNQQAINQSMDVGFSDPTGKLFTTTKFDFLIRRDHGFEAGEYTLVIKRTSDGAQMGAQQRITLQGENEIVDRRAIVFTGEKKDKPKTDPAASASADPKTDPPPSDTTTDPSTQPEATNTSPEGPEVVPPKQGGCGCRVADPPEGAGVGFLALAGLIALVARRPRKSAPNRIHRR